MKKSLILALPLIITLQGCDFESSTNDIDNIYSTILITNSQGYTEFNYPVIEDEIYFLPTENISISEESDLKKTIEEEKLIRDVLMYAFDYWGDNIFIDLSNAEHTHIQSLSYLFDKYYLNDPSYLSEGIFDDQNIQNNYDDLTIRLEDSRLEALKIGALLEEVSLVNTEQSQLNTIDNQDINLVYDNLLKASRNHLRALVSEMNYLGFIYSPLRLTTEEYNRIITTGFE